MRIRYCPECGRSIPLDSNLCPYCSKKIPMHDSQFVVKSKDKKDRTILIIIIAVLLIPVIILAISASVYVYTSGMIGGEYMSDIPDISFIKSDTSNNNTLTVAAVNPNVYWSDIDIRINGSSINHGLNGIILAGDVINITDLAGNGAYDVSIISVSTNTLLATFSFDD